MKYPSAAQKVKLEKILLDLNINPKHETLNPNTNPKLKNQENLLSSK
jgi:hypothetical protein